MKGGSAIKFPNGAGDDQRCDAIAYGCADNRKIGLRFRSRKNGPRAGPEEGGTSPSKGYDHAGSDIERDERFHAAIARLGACRNQSRL
jgi:hypothetical protein